MLPLRVRALPLAVLVLFLPSVLAAAPSDGPTVEVQLYEFGISPPGVQLDPGVNVTFRIVNVGETPHNLYVGEDGDVARWDPVLNKDGVAFLNFTVPAEGIIVYYCAVPGHRELGMVGNLTVTGSAPAPAAGGSNIGAVRALGVNYYAYWVGVVSFVILFVVLAATFFLLRYGETTHWTDQKDRPAKDAGTAPPKMTGTWVVLGIVLVLFLIAAVQVVRVM